MLLYYYIFFNNSSLGVLDNNYYNIQVMHTHTHTHTHTHSYTRAHAHAVCPPLTLGSGTVSYSIEMGVERNIGSVATHTCISGYRLLMQDGGNTRTCNISGWSGQDFICGEYLVI